MRIPLLLSLKGSLIVYSSLEVVAAAEIRKHGIAQGLRLPRRIRAQHTLLSIYKQSKGEIKSLILTLIVTISLSLTGQVA